VNSSDTLAPAGLRVIEGVASNAFRGIVGNEFDGLNDTINYLEKES